MEEKYSSEKLSLNKWIANFWYYHKWLFLLGVVFVLFAVIATVQYAAKTEPDASLLYVGPQVISNAQADNIRNSVVSVMTEDPDGNGKKSVDLKTITLPSEYGEVLAQEVPIDAARDAYQAYSDELLAGDSCILLLDETFFLELSADGALMPLDEALGAQPENADAYGIRLKELKIRHLPGFSSLSGDTVLCIKYVSAQKKESLEELARIEEGNKSVFRDLVTYAP